jgi:hypothetical protein
MSKLTMHEAILAGASAIRSQAGTQYETQPDGTISGCALGMANVAAGAKYVTRTEPFAAGENPRSAGTAGVWGQWGQWVKKVVPRPCDCTHKSEREMDAEAWKLTHQRDDGFDGSMNWLNYMHIVGDRRSGVMIFRLLEPSLPIEDIIPHLFDNHVACENPSWTIEQLADWVKSVEPEEDPAAAMYSTPWPMNWMQPYYYVGVDWSHHPLHGAYASAPNAAMTPGNEITLSQIKGMVELLDRSVKAKKEETVGISIEEDVTK